jgi:hypothetical protein
MTADIPYVLDVLYLHFTRAPTEINIDVALEPNFINEGSVHGSGIQYGIRYTCDFYTIKDVSIFGIFPQLVL